MKIKIKKFFFIFTNIIITLFLFEFSLRFLTPFPLNDGSNVIDDINLVYKMSRTAEKEIDIRGFRNKKDRFNDYDIAAIGDSHTYGWNTIPENSWPQILEKKTGKKIYNFGVGSYNIYQFFYLATENIERNKSLIIQIGPTQDFVNYHNFSRQSDFWVKHNRNMKLDLFSNTLIRKNNIRPLNKIQKFKILLKNNIATISLFDHYLWNNYLKQKDDKQNYINKNNIYLGQELGFINKTRLESIKENTNSNNIHIQKNIYNFEKFLIYFNQNIEKNKIMFSIFPTRERIYYEYLLYHNKKIDRYFEKIIKNEIEFEKKIINLIKRYDYIVVNASPYILSEFNKFKDKKNFYPDEDHPNPIGYEMIAESILQNKNFFYEQ